MEQQTKQCALCRGYFEKLELSHIIPKFVFRSMKKQSATGKMRNLENPNRPIQDGDKLELLCGTCEDLFNQDETMFANTVFHNYQNEKLGAFNYGPWLQRFIVSVNWRALYVDLEGFVKDKDVDSLTLDKLIEYEETMRKYLLGEQDDLGKIENHIFFFDAIKKAPSDMHKLDLHTIMLGSILGYTVIQHDFDAIYVFTNLYSILIVTILQKYNGETWENTKVEKEGLIDPKSNPANVSSPFFNEILYIAEKRKKAMKSLSENQKQKIIDSMKQNIDRVRKSRSFKLLQLDRNLRKE